MYIFRYTTKQWNRLVTAPFDLAHTSNIQNDPLKPQIGIIPNVYMFRYATKQWNRLVTVPFDLAPVANIQILNRETPESEPHKIFKVRKKIKVRQNIGTSKPPNRYSTECVSVCDMQSDNEIISSLCHDQLDSTRIQTSLHRTQNLDHWTKT